MNPIVWCVLLFKPIARVTQTHSVHRRH